MPALSASPLTVRGHSIVGGKRLDWETFDAFAIPGGEWCEHINGSDSKDAVIFVTSDEPTLKKLGFYRKHLRNENGDVIRLD